MHHGGDPGQSHDTNTFLCADDVTLESMGQTSERPVLYVSTVTSHYSNTHNHEEAGGRQAVGWTTEKDCRGVNKIWSVTVECFVFLFNFMFYLFIICFRILKKRKKKKYATLAFHSWIIRGSFHSIKIFHSLTITDVCWLQLGCLLITACQIWITLACCIFCIDVLKKGIWLNSFIEE